MGKKVTSLRIDEELWKKARKYCIDHNTTVSDLVEQLLIERLTKRGLEKPFKSVY